MFDNIPSNELEFLMFMTFYQCHGERAWIYIHNWYKMYKDQEDLRELEMLKRIMYAINRYQ